MTITHTDTEKCTRTNAERIARNDAVVRRLRAERGAGWTVPTRPEYMDRSDRTEGVW